MSLLQQFQNRAATLRELFTFLRERKLWWMMPLVIFMLLLGALLVFAHVGSVAPWMYPF